MHPDKYILKYRIAPGRRHYKRVETRQGVWIYWSCEEKLEDTSRVRDVSLGGGICRDTRSAGCGRNAQA